ncbi:MAG: hypothetical protein QOK09_3017, partial [Mycobacterium sp.]|nr:hypothetical protein [Mycobacterium sp.]
ERDLALYPSHRCVLSVSMEALLASMKFC